MWQASYASGGHQPWHLSADLTALRFTRDYLGFGDIAEIHSLGTAVAAGSYCCQPAGGQASRWSLTLPFHAVAGQVITIVVHTGGHVAPVERFAVTSVRAR